MGHHLSLASGGSQSGASRALAMWSPHGCPAIRIGWSDTSEGDGRVQEPRLSAPYKYGPAALAPLLQFSS